MGRKAGVDITEKLCNEVLAKITDTLQITPEEIFEVARRWCEKDYQHHRNFAIEKGVVPIALLIVALLWVDHPLLVSPSRGMMYSIPRAAAEIIQAELHEKDVQVPIRHSIHSPIEKNLINVDGT